MTTTRTKFQFVYDTVKDGISRLNDGKISIEQAKALSSLAKQANNVLATQLAAAKFLSSTQEAERFLDDVGI